MYTVFNLNFSPTIQTSVTLDIGIRVPLAPVKLPTASLLGQWCAINCEASGAKLVPFKLVHAPGNPSRA